MGAPTLGFSMSPEDQDRVQRLAARYAHGNRSAWLRQAIDLFEEKALFDTLAQLQGRGDQRTASQGIDRDTLAGLVAAADAAPNSVHARRVTALLEQFTGAADLDELDADQDAADTFMAAAESRGHYDPSA